MKRFALLLALCMTASAQEATKFFRLDFVVKEFDENKLLSAKTYSTFMSTDQREQSAIRTGNRVNYTNLGNANFLDVGVNIDCARLQEVNGQLMVQVRAELTSLPGGEIPANSVPTIRTNRWNAFALIPIGKASTLFSSDEQNSRRRMQVDLTATPIK